MEKKEIIVKVCNAGISFNPRLSIPIQQTNIPYADLTFRTHDNIFWKVEMLEYEADQKCLKVRVLDYSISDISKFDNQKPKKEIEQVLFEKFDWKKLEPILTSYCKISLHEILFNIESEHFSRGENRSTKPDSIDFNNVPDFTVFQQEEQKPYITTITEDFSVFFTDAHFMLGYVTFKKHIKKLGIELDFKIQNEHILAEFDNIKFWFAKKFQTKKFKVTATVSLIGDQVTETMASSEHINLISPEFIDSVKYQRTLALKKEPKITTLDKALFTAEEIFNQIDSGDIEGNIFNQSEQDILNFFLEKKNVRNKKQLEYLSGKKQSENQKLRYTLNPNFGFLFLVEGVENNHFVWELLDSHATYIWSIEKSDKGIELQFKRIESIVNTVRTSGRDKYKSAYKNNHQDNDIVFRVINHKDIDSNVVDNFPKWKNKLNEQLT